MNTIDKNYGTKISNVCPLLKKGFAKTENLDSNFLREFLAYQKHFENWKIYAKANKLLKPNLNDEQKKILLNLEFESVSIDNLRIDGLRWYSKKKL